MKTQIAVLALAGLCLGGCAKDQLAPLIFVQSNAFGVVASAGTTSQGAELTVGYHNYDVAIVPVTVKDSAGNVVQLQAFTSNGTPCPAPVAGATVAPECANGGVRDALSVIGQFESTTSSAATGLPGVGLGTFFATGQAAAKLADGFAAKLGKTP
jgi:hypothetical protein